MLVWLYDPDLCVEVKYTFLLFATSIFGEDFIGLLDHSILFAFRCRDSLKDTVFVVKLTRRILFLLVTQDVSVRIA